MKKYIYSSLIALFCLTAFTACEDMLKEDTFGKPTADEILSNEDNIVLMVAQAYADLKFVHDHWGYWGVNTLTADEGLCPTRAGGDWADGGYWKNLNTHNWNAYGEAFKCIWNRTVSGAVLCNNLLQTLADAKDNMTEATYKQYKGELEVLRSYYYYMLFDCFGRIPYMEDYSDRHEELLDPQITWAHLVACLENNAPNMVVVNDGNRASQLGRMTQGVAYTLLARLYLNAESFGVNPATVMNTTHTIVYSNGDKQTRTPMTEIDKDLSGFTDITSSDDFYVNANRCCDKVIASGSYAIEGNYFDNFLMFNEKSNENILVIVEDGSKDNERNVDKVKNKLQISFLTLHYSHQTLWPKLQDKPWNGFCARPNYLKIFNGHDVRGAGIGVEDDGTHNPHQWAWFVGPLYKQGSNDVIVDPNKSCTADSLVILTPEITSDPSKPVTENSSLSEAIRTSGARMIKYQIDTAGTYRYCENDFVLFRYADVILMKAEALAHGAGAATGEYNQAVSQMKKRAFAYSATPESDFDAAYPDAFTGLSTDLTTGILAERGRELSWECARRRDLIRFGQFEKVQYVTGAGLNNTRRWFPIPYSVLQKSSIKEDGTPYWTQNAGY
ncbi:MAG: RagB/SusD family nutrient uptake outer membrane protein [Paludibacteraceae bacterium]|nr:RagB/SusD family nutrient uptake outer membrane protein [Paludibacteraceae bacterium]